MPKNNENQFEAKKPKYKNDGVAVWENKDKNNNTYLTIKIVGLKTITAFENKKEK